MARTLIVLVAALLTAALWGVLALGEGLLDAGFDPSRLAVACGARGERFAVYCVGSNASPDAIPFLRVNGIPYPTHFERTSHPSRALSGDGWWRRHDPGERGEREGWFELASDAELAAAGWERTRVPSTWNSARSDWRDTRGVVWLRRRFALGPAPAGHPLARLAFDGVLLRAEVWLNGERIGSREGGYTPFHFDVSDLVRHAGPGEPPAENELVVRVDHRLTRTSLPPRLGPRHNPGWADYGGIHRDVRLDWLPDPYVFKAVARPVLGPSPGFALEVLTWSGRPGSDYRLSVSIVAPNGETRVESTRANRALAGPHGVRAHRFRIELPADAVTLWRPEQPALYDVSVALAGETAISTWDFRTGLREIRTDGPSLHLNGEPIFLRGVSKHEDDPELGATQTPESIERDLAWIERLGANYVRLAHYPHDVRAVLAARDRGFLLGEEIPLYQAGIGFAAWFVERQAWRDFPWREFGMRQLGDRRLLLRAQQQLIEMIERDANNPALVLWGVANETYTWGEGAAEVHGWLADVARRFDPTRLVTVAELTTDRAFLDSRRRASRDMDVVSVNLYHGWYYGEADAARAHLEDLHARHPDRPILISEFGAGAALGRTDADGVWRAERVRLERTYSEGHQERLVRTYLDHARGLDFVVGVSPWVFADFLCPWFAGNPVPGYNVKGLLSRDREPKQAFHALARIYARLAEGAVAERRAPPDP